MGLLNTVLNRATARRGVGARRPARPAAPARGVGGGVGGGASRRQDEAIGRGVRGLLRRLR